LAEQYGIGVMERLARETGGADFDAGNGNVRAIFGQIAKEPRASYELACLYQHGAGWFVPEDCHPASEGGAERPRESRLSC
jgi:hypothetical protein